MGDVFCGQIAYKSGKSKYTINCEGAVGKSVKIIQNDNILTLCEVQAFGEPSDDLPLFNVAPGRNFF